MQQLHRKWHNFLVTLLLVVNTFATPLSVFAQENENDTTVETTIVSPTIETEAEVQPVEPTEDNSDEGELSQVDSSSQDDDEAKEDEEEIHFSVNGTPKTLTEVIKDVQFFSPDLREMTANPLVFVKNANYRLNVDFNLSKYNNNLNNGDTFTFNIPAPMTVIPKSVELPDPKTGVTIADAVVTSAGPGQGGTATVTLKNLEQYLATTGGAAIVDVLGFFTFDFKFENNTEQELPLEGVEAKQSVNIKVVTPTAQTIGADGEVLFKQGGTLADRVWNSDILGKNGTKLHPWGLILNRGKENFGTLKVVDEMSLEGSPFQFIPEQFKLYEVTYAEGNRTYKRGRQLSTADHVVFSNNYTKFELTIPNAGQQQYVLEYSTTAPGNNTNITNVAHIMNDDVVVKPYNRARSNYEVKSAYSQQAQGIALATANRIIIFKVDADNPSIPLQGAKFLITSNKGYRKEFVSNEKGVVHADKEPLSNGEYTITEVEAPAGYAINPTPMVVQVGNNGIIRTWPNKKLETTTFTVTKNWVNGDANNRPAVQFQLKRDGVPYGDVKTLDANAQDGATVVWENLPKYQDGTTTLSVYTAEELLLEDYTPTISEETETSVTITNTYSNNETVSLNGKKIWNDYANKFNTRPDKITVTVLQDGAEFNKTVEVTGEATANEWTFEVRDLPKYNSMGQLHAYTLKEESVAGYTTEYGVDNTITNTYVNNEKINITVTKDWQDYNNKFNTRPANIIFNLKRDGQTTQNAVVTADDNWRTEFTNLSKYHPVTGEVYTYTVEEAPVANYDAPVVTGDVATGFTVTNTYVNTEVTSLTGKKIWKDYANKFNTRPNKITVTVLQDGAEFNKTVEVTGEATADEWTFEVQDLPKYNAVGEAYTYSVKETPIAGYTTEYGADNTITNTYVNNEKINITVTKDWKDYNNKFNTRPANIIFNLKRDGQTTQNAVVTADDNWRTEFTNLSKYHPVTGEVYTYTVEEDPVANYGAPVVSGDAVTGFTVTNTYRNTETIDISGKKTWDDANNQDNKRPDNITVQVMNGNQKVAEKTVSQADNWAYTFTGLPKYDTNGELIPYTVTEVPVAEYQAMVEGYNITNSYTPAKTQVSVTKVWEDADNQDGKRPAQISVQLLANGVVQGQPITLNASNNWMHTWNDLALNQAGQPIVYTLQEVNVPAGYTSNIAETAAKQFTITNTYTPEKIGLTGKKTWEDANNQDGKRPDTITVNLLAEGKIVQTVTANQASNWTYNFIDLPKYKAGQLIEYTVQEVVPAGYSATYSGYSITNSYTPAKTQVSVTKVWEDANNQDGIRPNDIQVQLYANGTAQGQPITLNAGNNWMHTWNDLDLKQQGQDIVYTVKEVGEVTGYTTAITEPATKQFTLTNSHTPEVIEVSGKKTWEDANNQDGKRPSNITVHLIA
ncbi:Cna B-type domain-containing protein, partial [Aerococcaceae bacterium NML201209]|nr:Cna B-type domain-containing protein [Aerococcaceae bacterium NML201209]